MLSALCAEEQRTTDNERLKNDLTTRGNSITYTGACDLICRQEKRLDDPSSNSCILAVVRMSQQDRGLGLVRLKFVLKRP
jgi:hypothetical protein